MGDRIAGPHPRICVPLLAGCCISVAVALPARAAPTAPAAEATSARGASYAATGGESSAPAGPLDAVAAARFAALALKCLHQEYPNHISHTLNSDADARPPHELTPAFYGCLDWHSDVHGHWLLVRLMRLFPDAPFVSEARTAVARSRTSQARSRICTGQGAPRSSDPTDSPGSCSSRPSCVARTMPMHGAGPRRSRHSRA